MNQHISSMFEHFSSLRRKNSESAQTSSSDKQNATIDDDQKDVSEVETMSSKTKNIFKDLISSDNGATNIFQNLNFMKCTSISTHLNATTTSANTTNTIVSSSSNGSCRQKQEHEHLELDGHNDDNNNNSNNISSSNNNQLATNLLQPTTTTSETNSVNNNKRNSLTCMTMSNGNGGLNQERELSASPRTHRKSSHDIRSLRNNHMQNCENQDVGKAASVIKPLRTKNIITKNETFDTLHNRGMEVSNFIKISI